MRCPQCGSLETETLTRIDLIGSLPEGDVVVVEAGCLRCGFVFTHDDFVPRPEQETVQ
ncbi:hypothetical protein MUP79_09780 [Candidatus Bathyarchaeota archaeon]|nr:hypothetical protein [Candidatus Bathyarchaeota archaeon]